MSHLHLIDWRARVDCGKRRPAVRRFVRRMKAVLLFAAFWLAAGILAVCGGIFGLAVIQHLRYWGGA